MSKTYKTLTRWRDALLWTVEVGLSLYHFTGIRLRKRRTDGQTRWMLNPPKKLPNEHYGRRRLLAAPDLGIREKAVS